MNKLTLDLSLDNAKLLSMAVISVDTFLYDQAVVNNAIRGQLKEIHAKLLNSIYERQFKLDGKAVKLKLDTTQQWAIAEVSEQMTTTNLQFREILRKLFEDIRKMNEQEEHVVRCNRLSGCDKMIV